MNMRQRARGILARLVGDFARCLPIMKSILSGVLTCETSQSAGAVGVSTADRIH